MLGHAMRVLALAALTEPPYRMRTAAATSGDTWAEIHSLICDWVYGECRGETSE
jgi:hypothetical protein